MSPRAVQLSIGMEYGTIKRAIICAMKLRSEMKVSSTIGMKFYDEEFDRRTTHPLITSPFHHSNCTQPGIVGFVEVTRAAYPDEMALDSSSIFYDPKSSPETPRWFKATC